MATLEEKLSLLAEKISFSVVDGKIHEREYGFISLIAQELGIEKEVINNLFQEEIKPLKIFSETARVQQFYRLALLMHVDGVLHEKEDNSLHEIGIKMGLNPQAMNTILKLMKNSDCHTLDAKILFKAFDAQHN
jgi:uncharacterized tellurite resistance protein B-like protein